MPRNITLSGYNTFHTDFPKLLAGEIGYLSVTYADNTSTTERVASRPVATEDELLGFANAIRQAGGGQPLPELLNARPGAASQCLIAKAVNFESSVQPNRGKKKTFSDGSKRWIMETKKDIAVKINEFLGLEIEKSENAYLEGVWLVYLPIHIGNAAQAFDEEKAFTQYNQNHVALSDPYSFKDKSVSYLTFDDSASKFDPFKLPTHLDTKTYGLSIFGIDK